MKFQHIFWDNDGVLVDTERFYLQASLEALSKVRITLNDSQFATIYLGEGRSLFDLVVDREISEKTFKELRAWRNKRYSELLEQKDMALPRNLSDLTRNYCEIS